MKIDFCQGCGDGQTSAGEPAELLFTDDDQALCVLCSIEIVFCECGESLRRLEVQFAAAGDVCTACAANPPQSVDHVFLLAA